MLKTNTHDEGEGEGEGNGEGEGDGDGDGEGEGEGDGEGDAWMYTMYKTMITRLRATSPPPMRLLTIEINLLLSLLLDIIHILFKNEQCILEFRCKKIYVKIFIQWMQ